MHRTRSPLSFSRAGPCEFVVGVRAFRVDRHRLFALCVLPFCLSAVRRMHFSVRTHYPSFAMGSIRSPQAFASLRLYACMQCNAATNEIKEAKKKKNNVLPAPPRGPYSVCVFDAWPSYQYILCLIDSSFVIASLSLYLSIALAHIRIDFLRSVFHCAFKRETIDG